jgi:hypothetical protein
MTEDTELIKGDDNIDRMVLEGMFRVIFMGIFVFYGSKWILKICGDEKKMEIPE